MSQNSPLIPDEEATAQPANQGEAVIDRILRRGARAAALGADADHGHSDTDGDQFDLEDRSALRRVSGLSTELQDITEVEYRQLRLEKVLLIGLWGEQTLQDAENSLRELAALAETAGSEVLDGLLQRRAHPDPATYLGVARVFDLNPNQVMLVAAHQDDLAAARACGLQTAHIERPAEFGLAHIKDVSPDPANTLHARDFLDLADQLSYS